MSRSPMAPAIAITCAGGSIGLVVAAIACTRENWVVMLFGVTLYGFAVVGLLGLMAVALLSIRSSLVESSSTSARLGATIEELRAESGSAKDLVRIEKHLEAFAADLQSVRHALRTSPGGLRHGIRHDAIRDVAALLNLHSTTPVKGEHVPLTSYSALPATALLLSEYVRELPSGGKVAEFGSGATTVWMALASAQRGGDITVTSLESSADYAEVTKRSLDRNKVGVLVDLRVARLDTIITAHGEQKWYSKDAWDDLRDVNLVFVDGPPGKTGPMARYPVVETMHSRLAPNAIVVVDDANRQDEQALIEALLATTRNGESPVILEERERTVAILIP